MTLTASDVSSLTRSLSGWEYAEYGACAFVAIACAGEYIADFTNWLTAGDEERKKRLAKRSTLLLIVSLAVELFCLVQTNSISGQLIGSLSDKATNADTKAQSALEKSGTAETKAGDAATKADKAEEKSSAALAKAEAAEKSLGKAENEADRAQKAASNAFGIANDAKQVARDARQEADTFESDIKSAKQQAAAAESHLADALRQAADAEREVIRLNALLADRIITPDQQRRITAAFTSMKGQTVDVVVVGDSLELSKTSNAILKSIRDAGVFINFFHPISGLGGAEGVIIGIRPDAPNEAKQAGNGLIAILHETLDGGVAAYDFDKIAVSGTGTVGGDKGALPVGQAPIRLQIAPK